MSTWFLALLCRAQSFLQHAKNPRLLRTLAMVSTRVDLGITAVPKISFELSSSSLSETDSSTSNIVGHGISLRKSKIFFACELLFDFSPRDGVADCVVAATIWYEVFCTADSRCSALSQFGCFSWFSTCNCIPNASHSLPSDNTESESSTNLAWKYEPKLSPSCALKASLSFCRTRNCG